MSMPESTLGDWGRSQGRGRGRKVSFPTTDDSRCYDVFIFMRTKKWRRGSFSMKGKDLMNCSSRSNSPEGAS
jgi:hypothetical protein